MKENRRLANRTFGLQTPDVCEHSRLCGGPHYQSFITRELCADAVFFHFLCFAGSNRPPPISLQPTALRSLSVRQVLTARSAKFRFFPTGFLSLFVPLFGAAGDQCVWSAAKASLVFLLETDFVKIEFVLKEGLRQRASPRLREGMCCMSAGPGKIKFLPRS